MSIPRLRHAYLRDAPSEVVPGPPSAGGRIVSCREVTVNSTVRWIDRVSGKRAVTTWHG